MAPAATMRIENAAAQAYLPSVRLRPRLVQGSRGAPVNFGDRLTRQCAEIAGKFAGARAITLTCSAAGEHLPPAMATQLSLLAAELVASAFNTFERHQNGRIGVSFQVCAVTLMLTVEHSRPSPRAAGYQGVAHSWLARTLIARLGGRLENAIVIGGARVLVTVPRP